MAQHERDSAERRRAEDALRESDERFKTVFAHAAVGLAVVATDGRFLQVNQAFCRMLGCTEADLVGTHFSSVTHPDDQEKSAGYLERILGGEISHYQLEKRFLRRSGEAVVTNVSVSAIQDPDGSPRYFIGLIEDVTKRKRAEQKLVQTNETLREAEEKYRMLVEQIPAVLYIELPGEDETTLYVSPQVEPILGLTQQQYLDDLGLWRRHIHEDDRDAITADYRAFLADPSSSPVHTQEYRIIRPDGRVVWIHDRVTALRDEQGVPHLVQGVMFDVTEAKLAEAAVHATHEMLQATIESTADGILVVDNEGRTSYANARFGEMWRIPGDLLAERSDEKLLAFVLDQLVNPGDFLAKVQELYRTNREDFDTLHFKDGRLFERYSRPLLDGDRVDGRVWSFRDVTEREDASRRLLEAFNQEREVGARLRALDEMKNTFLTAVSHELRTPLSAILGLALTLERDDLDLPAEESRELVTRLASNARKLERLLSDLLDLDRLARGILEPHLSPTDLGALVHQVVENADLAGRTILVQVPSIVVPLDGAKVERMVENLIVNAVRHTPPDVPIWVRAERQDGGVLIAVEDAGPGVPEDLRGTLFEPFRQGPGTPKHSPGVGIGLSLVARFAELHGGRAWVEARPGGGASFRVLLPGDNGADAAGQEMTDTAGQEMTDVAVEVMPPVMSANDRRRRGTGRAG